MHYTDISSSDILSILSNYSLGTFISLNKIEHGWANSNYRVVTTEGNLFMKVCNEKSYEELLVQIQILEAMEENGVFTAYPYKTGEGDVILKFNGLDVILYRWLDGYMGTESNRTEKHVVDIAETIAKFHLVGVPEGVRLPKFPMGATGFMKFIENDVDLDVHVYLKEIRRRYLEIEDTIVKDWPSGMIHSDVFLDNCLFNDDGLVAVVDFEDVSNDAFLIDVAMTILGCCYNEDDTMNLPLAIAFVEKYNEIRQLSEEEKHALVPFLKYSILCIAFWRYRQFNVSELGEEIHKERYKHMETRYLADFDQFQSAILHQ